MKIPQRKEKPEENILKLEKKVLREDGRGKKTEKPKDPTRWLPLLFLLIFLFISYLSWVTYIPSQ